MLAYATSNSRVLLARPPWMLTRPAAVRWGPPAKAESRDTRAAKIFPRPPNSTISRPSRVSRSSNPEVSGRFLPRSFSLELDFSRWSPILLVPRPCLFERLRIWPFHTETVGRKSRGNMCAPDRFEPQQFFPKIKPILCTYWPIPLKQCWRRCGAETARAPYPRERSTMNTSTREPVS